MFRNNEGKDVLNKVLKKIAGGESDTAVEILVLKPNRHLVNEKGNITVPDGRTFENITPLQLAYWSWDLKAIECMISQGLLTEEELKQQIDAFSISEHAKKFGVQFNFSALLPSVDKYLDSETQRQIPACIVKEFFLNNTEEASSKLTSSGELRALIDQNKSVLDKLTNGNLATRSTNSK